MKIGDILYHERYGRVVVTERKYSPIGNKVVFVTRDDSGVKHSVDGTEIPYQEHEKTIESSRKISDERKSKDSSIEKRHSDVVNMISEIKDEIRSGNKAILEKEPVHVETKDVKIPDFPKFPEKMTVNVPDLSSIEKKLDSLLKKDNSETNDLIREAIDSLKDSKTDKELAKAIINVGKAIPNTPDYSDLLKEISGKLVDTQVESMKIDEDQFKLLTKAIASIRSGGGGGGLVAIMDVDRNQINPATEEKQDALIGNYALKLDDTTTANVTYVGKAAIGSSTASAVWQIKKIDETSGMVITWSDGNALFDNVWDNRASLSYS